MTKPTAQPHSDTWQERFLANLDKAIQYHTTGQSNPSDLVNPALLALYEVKTAFREAQERPNGWKS